MLVCVSANHTRTPFDVLERLSAGGAVIAPRILDDSSVRGAVVLATCNRYETYLEIDSDDRTDDHIGDGTGDHIGAIPHVHAVLAHTAHVDTATIADAVTTLTGDGVVDHLFAVSSGLRSVVVGEDDIAGQVRRSLETARRLQTSSPGLERLFQRASTTSKGVKTRTAIGHAGRSIVRLALQLAASRISDWTTTPVLLIGTGDYAATTVASLRDRGVQHIAVYSPSGRADAFSERLGLHAEHNLADALGRAAIVITCTSNAEPVVTPELFGHSLSDHRLPGNSVPRLIVDLGLPRNVHPDVADIPGVELLDLETIRIHAPLEELTATADAHELVTDAATRFRALEAERRAAPAIATLRRRVFDVLDDEIERMRRRGTWSADAESDMRHLIGVLLHHPSERARHAARDGDSDRVFSAVETLFGPVDDLTRRRGRFPQAPADHVDDARRA